MTLRIETSLGVKPREVFLWAVCDVVFDHASEVKIGKRNVKNRQVKR